MSAPRLLQAWRNLPGERRLAAVAAILLFVSLFFPWYQETVIGRGSATNLQSTTSSLTGWSAFSFVEAAILLVAGAVLTLLYQRAEGRAFHIPGGDGGVIMAAGLWTCVLVIWRIFDKQGTTSNAQFATTSGIEWGILVALGVAGLLAYAGSRIRSAHVPEPPLPGERLRPPPLLGERPPEAPLPGERPPDAPLPGERPPDAPLPGERPAAAPLAGERPPEG
jgi:hypothetical protein